MSKPDSSGGPASNQPAGRTEALQAEVIEAAKRAREARISVCPPVQDGSKAPLADYQTEDGRWTWKPLQSEPADSARFDHWYGTRTGVGWICGTVSGGLCVLDFDTPEAFELYVERAGQCELGPLVDRLAAGYLSQTPSGGHHLPFFNDEERRNTKLAMRPGNAPSDRKTTIELKAEGGFIVEAPSYGNVHPSGKPYERLRGDVKTIATVSGPEFDALIELAQSFDAMPKPAEEEPRSEGRQPTQGLQPGDDYASQNTWANILEKAGWKFCYVAGEETFWRRPGKSDGVSASTNYAGNGLFYVWSTSTDFETGKSYTKFGAYARLYHKGDYAAAARALSQEGYGSKATAPGPRREPRRSGSGEDGPIVDLAIRVKEIISTDEGPSALLRNTDLLDELASTDPIEVEAIILDNKAVTGWVRPFRAEMKRRKAAVHLERQSEYRIEGTGFVWISSGENGPVTIPLSNFTARIIEEILRDNGLDRTTIFRIEAVMADRRILDIEIPSKDFEGLAWVIGQLGSDAIIAPGRATRDHLRVAIQTHSKGAIKRTVYGHTGWREIDGEWKYLHAGGAIGRDGLDESVCVDLDAYGLGEYRLPTPPDGDDLRKAVRASLGILRLAVPNRPGSLSASAILLTEGYGAVLGQSSSSGQLSGPTGSFKSSSAALALQHYGAGLYQLPSGFNSTNNALQFMRYVLKDALLVIDDLVIAGSHHDRARMERAVDDLFRTQGNGTGRRRMAADASAIKTMEPRSGLLTTGEDRAGRDSANLRTIGIWLTKDDPATCKLGTIDSEILKACQADASAGLYAASMAAYLRWMAGRYPSDRDSLPGRAALYRPLATTEGDHGRTPDIVADLTARFDTFLEFAVESGAISKPESIEYAAMVWDGLMEAAGEIKREHHTEEDVALVFISSLISALTSQRFYLADSRTGGPPEGKEAACGWKIAAATANFHNPTWESSPNASRVGWVCGDFVYLDAGAAHKAAAQMLPAGASLPATATLNQKLDKAGLIAEKDPRRDKVRMTTRKTVEGSQQTVLVLRTSDFWPPDPDQDLVLSTSAEDQSWR